MGGHWSDLSIWQIDRGAKSGANCQSRGVGSWPEDGWREVIRDRCRLDGLKWSLLSKGIHSRANGVNPFDYMMAVVGNPETVRADPGGWMPWNYEQVHGR